MNLVWSRWYINDKFIRATKDNSTKETPTGEGNDKTIYTSINFMALALNDITEEYKMVALDEMVTNLVETHNTEEQQAGHGECIYPIKLGLA